MNNATHTPTENTSEMSAGNGGTVRVGRWALVAAVILLVVYVPGILLGTIGAGPGTNDLRDPVAFVFTVCIYGTLFALIGFGIGAPLGALLSLPVALVVWAIRGYGKRFPMGVPMAGALLVGTLCASAALAFVVLMFGIG